MRYSSSVPCSSTESGADVGSGNAIYRCVTAQSIARIHPNNTPSAIRLSCEMEPERPPAFRTKKEGVDPAFFRAVFIAGPQAFIWGGTGPRSLPPAMPAAPIGIVDRQGGA